jgi:hypothetical protein
VYFVRSDQLKNGSQASFEKDSKQFVQARKTSSYNDFKRRLVDISKSIYPDLKDTKDLKVRLYEVEDPVELNKSFVDVAKAEK